VTESLATESTAISVWAPERQVVLSKVMPSLSASLVKFDGLLSAEATSITCLINRLI
jgi:hypothetical protein